MSEPNTLCIVCNKEHNLNPDMGGGLCDSCSSILYAYDFLLWTKKADKKGQKIDKKRRADSIKLINIHKEHLHKMLERFQPKKPIEEFSDE